MLRIVVGNKKDALIVDFFAGSGTTMHAVMRLNRQDGGHRRSVLVTNNEVSADEEAQLRLNGFTPGNGEWESLGIFEYIAKPRIKAAITGQTPDGDDVKGDYRFKDEFPMADGFEENVEFFDLTYEDPGRVEHDLEFAAVAPLLWMRAGSVGRRIEKPTHDYDIADSYGVLFDVDAAADFVGAVTAVDGINCVFIVTDDEGQFQMIVDELPRHVEKIRLYESYLRTFEINSGKD